MINLEKIRQLRKIRKKLFVTDWKEGEKLYYSPFDDHVFPDQFNFSGHRFEFCIRYEDKYIGVSNGQVNQENNRYHITGINTPGYCRQMGNTNLIFSYLLLKLMNCHKDSEFSVYIKNGTEVQNTLAETGIYIYRKIFNQLNVNVNVTFNISGESYSYRKFPLETREKDYEYFLNLYQQQEQKILAQAEEICENYKNYFK